MLKVTKIWMKITPIYNKFTIHQVCTRPTQNVACYFGTTVVIYMPKGILLVSSKYTLFVLLQKMHTFRTSGSGTR